MNFLKTWFVQVVLFVAAILGLAVNFPSSKLFLVGSALVKATPDLPTILGMLAGDFLVWLATPAVLGALLALVFAQLPFIPQNVVGALTSILSAAIGAAITAAIPHIDPSLLGATIYQVILMGIAGVIAWVTSFLSQTAVVSLYARSVPGYQMSLGKGRLGD